DTGTGIAPEDLQHIFNTYVSRDAETNNNGYGLGLALCKIIVEKLGGKIYVESKLGEGSLFHFVLPFEGTIGGIAPARNTTTSNVRTIRVSGRPDDKNKKTILVAEDEDSNYELVKIVLHKRYRLIRAHNGIEAVTMNEEEHPDLILMDIRMPEMNGLELAKRLRNGDKDICNIFMSSTRDFVFESFPSAPEGYLCKPFEYAAFAEVMDRTLNKLFAEKKYFKIRLTSGEIDVASEEIVAVLSNNHSVSVKMITGEILESNMLFSNF
uniref:hybrid sensor histidine kinase/response regulator n=1 Tax=Ruminococcus flavefaciens TaxID=1265 RepID=UPI00156587D0